MTSPDENAEKLLDTIRAIALALPDVSERLSHGAPCFYVRRRPLLYFHSAEFSTDGRTAVWCPAPSGDRRHWTQRHPDQYFAPTPSASSVFGDWIGAYLDGENEAAPDWDEIAELIDAAFRLIAPRTLIAQLDVRPT